MIKVELIHHIYGAHKNGANTVINALLDNSEFFLEKGIDIHSTRPSGAYRDTMDNSKSKVAKKMYGLVVDGVNRFLTYCAQYSRFAAMLAILVGEDHLAKKTLGKYFSEHEIHEDVLFFHAFFTCYHYMKKRRTYKPVVLVLHTNGDTFNMLRSRYRALEKSCYYKRLLKNERKILNMVDRIVFVSEASRTNFLNLHPYVLPEKVFCVYNGVEVTPFVHRNAKSNHVLEVVCVASVSVRKGQHYIVEALSSMDNIENYNVHFTFVGDGPDRIRLEREVHSKQLGRYCDFVGVTSDVDKYLNKSDVFILPSEDEGLPMAIIEAMRAGLPIVSTPVGGIPEMIEDGYNGFLIQPSTDGIKSFLNKLATVDWKAMGKRSRTIFETKFSVDKMIDGYAKILNFE